MSAKPRSLGCTQGQRWGLRWRQAVGVVLFSEAEAANQVSDVFLRPESQGAQEEKFRCPKSGQALQS